MTEHGNSQIILLDQQIEAEELHWKLCLLSIADQIVGSCLLTPWNRDHVNLNSLVVQPEHRRKGYGTILINAGIDLARANGKAGIALVVSKKNLRAISLYRRLGFTTNAEDDKQFWMSIALNQ